MANKIRHRSRARNNCVLRRKNSFVGRLNQPINNDENLIEEIFQKSFFLEKSNFYKNKQKKLRKKFLSLF